MNRQFFEMVEANPIIAAVKDMEGLERCCDLEYIKVVFISIKWKVRVNPLKQYVTFKVHCNLLSELSGHNAQAPAFSTTAKG